MRANINAFELIIIYFYYFENDQVVQEAGITKTINFIMLMLKCLNLWKYQVLLPLRIIIHNFLIATA